MKPSVRPGLKLALILFSVLAVYFQTIYHPFSLFDDPGIVEHYGINSTLSFFDVIKPGSGFYYRPIVELSYWFDCQWWGMDSSFMHLENILAHLINVLLVFLIASRLPLCIEVRILPYVSALLFGLHPINSEPVNWIAGRTDLYAGVFVFIAVYCLIRAIQEQSARFALGAFGVALMGIITKETAIMFLPVALIVAIFWPVVPHDAASHKRWRTRFLVIPIVISSCLAFLLLVAAYSMGNGNSIISLIFGKSTFAFIRILEGFGFYIKKILLPLPLNLAIVEVSPWYALVGILSSCVLVITFRRIGISWIFFVSAVLFMLPALLIAVTSVAWTPFAERYLYIPSAFVVIGGVDCLYRFCAQRNSLSWFVPLAVVSIFISSIATFQRGMLWGNNFALVEDIVVKSPGFGFARNVYVGLLGQAGRYAEAEQQVKIALKQNNKESVGRVIRLNSIWLEISDKPLAEARTILLLKIANKINADLELLVHLNRLDEGMLSKESLLDGKRRIATEIFETNEILFSRTGEPFHLYRSGQIALLVDDNKKAAAYFRKAYNDKRLKEYYREPARRLAEKLEAK